MNEITQDAGAADDGERQSRPAMSPLPGEPGIPDVAAPQRVSVSKKGVLAVLLLLASLVAVTAVSMQRWLGGRHADDGGTNLVGDKPAAASADPRRLELPSPSITAPAPPSPRVPAIVPSPAESAEPIPLRGSSTSPKTTDPDDAPVMLVTAKPGGTPGQTSSATRTADGTGRSSEDALSDTADSLQRYQRQLQGLLQQLDGGRDGAPAAGPRSPAGSGSAHPPPYPSGSAPTASAGLFDGQLPASATPRTVASLLGHRSLTLPKGTAFTCALKTRVITAASGLIGCQVQRNVFSDDGRVLLVERGSHLDGEYRMASVRTGTVRIPVLWTRLRTPNGVSVDLESPAVGPLGESGIDGHVDNRWGERIGAAMLLSLIDDSVKLIIQNQASDRQANTIVLPSTTTNTSKLAEKVLDSTINIPPLIYQNQGGIVGIYVARDIDFSSVYELQPTAMEPLQR
jgi:type IV secretion system protein VirB10